MKLSLLPVMLPLAVVAAPAVAQDRPAPRIDIAKADNDRETLTTSGGRPYFLHLLRFRRPGEPAVAPIDTQGRFLGMAVFMRGAQVYGDVMPHDSGQRWDWSLGPVFSAGINPGGRVVDRQAAARGLALEAGGFVGVARSGLIAGAQDTLAFRLFYVRDVRNLHGRYVITPAIDYSIPLSGRLLAGMSLSVDYAGGDDIAPQRRDGASGDATRRGWQDLDVSGYVGIALNGNVRHGLMLVLAGGFGRMQGDFAASPVTQIGGVPDQFYGAVGLGYNF